jgi:hypothetical protein
VQRFREYGVRILAREKAAEQMPLYPKSLIPSTGPPGGRVKGATLIVNKAVPHKQTDELRDLLLKMGCPRFGYRRQ